VTVPTRDDGARPTDPASTAEPGGELPSGGDPQPQRTFTSPGGTVTVACTGPSTIRLVVALPDVTAGWSSQVETRGPDEVEVEFTDGDEELRTRARCDGGVVEPDVDTD
jgi:hypothetical protein